MKVLEDIQIRSELARSCRAIELGTTAVRSVALKRQGRRVALLELGEITIPRESPGSPPPEMVGKVLQQLMGESKSKTEVVVTSLPMHQVFMRSLVLPFTKLVQIQQVISSEAELHIPFPLDQVVIDFWPVEELAGGKSRVMMAAAKKDSLRQHLELLAGAGLDPARVGVDFLGLTNAFYLMGVIDPGEVTVLVEVGATHTGVAVLFQGRLGFIRSFTWGGDTMSAAIMKELGCGFAEAERRKTESGSDSVLEIEKAITGSFSTLEIELMQTLHSASSATGGRAPQHLILAGAATVQPVLKNFLVSKLNCPVLELDPWSGVVTGRSEVTPSRSAWGGLGLALSSLRPARKKLNFRQGEFSFQGSWEMIKRRLWVTLGFFLVLVAVWVGGLNFKIVAEEKRYQNGEEQIQSLLNSTFPGVKDINPGDEVFEMEEALKRMKEDFKYYRAFAGFSAFDILREISELIPPDIKVQVVELNIDQERVRFRGRTDSYRSAERIKNSFQKSKYFQADQIREGDTKTKMVGGKLVTVEFNYTLPLVAEGAIDAQFKAEREENPGPGVGRLSIFAYPLVFLSLGELPLGPLAGCEG